MTFVSSATTHVGMVRKVNQDSFAERTDIGVWAVADGMGGHEAGEIASATITDFIKNLPPHDNIQEMLAAVEQSIMAANLQLTEQAASYDSQRVPGSTVVVLQERVPLAALALTRQSMCSPLTLTLSTFSAARIRPSLETVCRRFVD